MSGYAKSRSIDFLMSLRGGAEGPAPSSPIGGMFSAGNAVYDHLIQKLIPGGDHHAKVVVAVFLSFCLQPLAKVYYEHISAIFGSERVTTAEVDVDGSIVTSTHRRQQFKGSRFYYVIETAVTAARLFLLVVFFDMGKSMALSLGIKIPKSDHISHVFGFGIYILWGFKRLSALKLYLLTKIMVNTDIINDPGRLQIINRLSDYVLIFFAIFAFYEVLNVEMGYSVKSLLAAFSFGTAVVSLATKDIITNFLNGIILNASDRIYEGDIISIQGDIKKVNRLGWLETSLRGTDNILYTVPNTELLTSKISNLSRIKTCQVHQTLHFPYSAMDKLQKVCFDIKSEIRLACPSIITDGSRPFRCYWINLGSKNLEVFVDAHFRIPPVGELYYENRQRCLHAIDRAIRKNEIEDYSGG